MGSSSLFADESGTSVGEPCYAIGVLRVPESLEARFGEEFEHLVLEHGVMGEVRWGKVRTSHGLMNCGIDLLKFVLTSGVSFNAIVVLKSAYKKWQAGDLEAAFYTTYSLVLEHTVRKTEDACRVFIDDRSDAYGKHDEVLGLVTNRMLDKMAASAKLSTVQKADSKKYPGIQTADFLTGAIKAAHHLYLEPSAPVSAPKKLLLRRLASMLSWDALHYDTMPNDQFDIWHFPWQEYRAVPQTRKVEPELEVQYITAEELAEVRSGGT